MGTFYRIVPIMRQNKTNWEILRQRWTGLDRVVAHILPTSFKTNLIVKDLRDQSIQNRIMVETMNEGKDKYKVAQ